MYHQAYFFVRQSFQKLVRGLLLVICATWFVSAGYLVTSGQPPRNEGSGRRVEEPYGSGTSGSGYRGQADLHARGTDRPLALEGYCPVCIRDMDPRRWVKGNSAFRELYDGRWYYFPGEVQQGTFAAGPQKYVPVLGGDCVVRYQETGQRIPANIRYGLFHGNPSRLYFFSSPEHRARFRTRPQQYQNADLAWDGDCAVCWRDQKKRVPGKSKFTSLDRGLRYQFSSAAEQKQFLSDPQKYRLPSLPLQ